MKRIGLTVLASALVAVLTACGGGNSEVDDSAMTLNLNPSGDKTLPASSTINITMSSNVRRTSTTANNTVSGMEWTLTANNGEVVNPKLSNENCAAINNTGVYAECSTTLTVPQGLTTGQWTLTASAKATSGTQRSERMLINVSNSVYNLSAGDAQTLTGDDNGIFTTALLKGKLEGTNSGKVTKVLWTQVSGPTVSLLNADTMNASFNPVTNTATEYKFQLSVTVDDINITRETTVTTNLKDVPAV